MATPGEDIDAYLESSGTAGPQRLRAAIIFAESMLSELRDSVAQWEKTATALKGIQRHNTPRPPVEWVPAVLPVPGRVSWAAEGRFI